MILGRDRELQHRVLYPLGGCLEGLHKLLGLADETGADLLHDLPAVLLHGTVYFPDGPLPVEQLAAPLIDGLELEAGALVQLLAELVPPEPLFAVVDEVDLGEGVLVLLDGDQHVLVDFEVPLGQLQDHLLLLLVGGDVLLQGCYLERHGREHLRRHGRYHLVGAGSCTRQLPVVVHYARKDVPQPQVQAYSKLVGRQALGHYLGAVGGPALLELDDLGEEVDADLAAPAALFSFFDDGVDGVAGHHCLGEQPLKP